MANCCYCKSREELFIVANRVLDIAFIRCIRDRGKSDEIKNELTTNLSELDDGGVGRDDPTKWIEMPYGKYLALRREGRLNWVSELLNLHTDRLALQ